MAMYQRMWLACVTVDSGRGKQTVVGISHFEQGASTHLSEELEVLGYTNQQIRRILDRARVTELKRRTLGCSFTFNGELSDPFSRKA